MPCPRLSSRPSSTTCSPVWPPRTCPSTLRVELRTRYYEDDRNSYNVIAEIPGTGPGAARSDRARRRAPGFVAHRERRHRQRRWRGRRHGGDAHPDRASAPAAAPHDPRGAVERRGAGAARRAGLCRAAPRQPGRPRAAGRLSERRPGKRQDARLLHGRERRRQGHLRSLAGAAEGPGRDAKHHRGHRQHRSRAVQRGRACRAST